MRKQVAQDQDATNMKNAQTPIEKELIPSIGSEALVGLFRAEEGSLSFTGKPLTALALARTQGVIDSINAQNMTIGDVTISSKYPNVISKLGAGETKLLRFGLSALAEANAQNSKTPRLRIYADTKKYARDRLKDPDRGIDPRQMRTPDEQEKENKRAAKALTNFIAKLNKNAEALLQPFTWQDIDHGKTKAYNGISLLGAYRIDSSVIMLEFTQTSTEYFLSRPLSPTPLAYYSIEDRQTTACAIAEALLNNYGIDRNVLSNRERILSVSTLLRYTSLPTLDECKEKRLGWEHFVKEPFETALEYLYTKGLIAPECVEGGKRISGGWHYCLPGMKELTDEQASDIVRYEQFLSLYVYYELTGYPSHDERVKEILDRRNLKRISGKK